MIFTSWHGRIRTYVSYPRSKRGGPCQQSNVPIPVVLPLHQRGMNREAARTPPPGVSDAESVDLHLEVLERLRDDHVVASALDHLSEDVE
jgi:hypothetical protein